MNNEFWSAMKAVCGNDEISANRPSVGTTVIIDKGRKYKGKVGKVVRHIRDKFDRDAWRYCSDAQAIMREARGRYGYVIKVLTTDGETFWCKADYATIIEVCA